MGRPRGSILFAYLPIMFQVIEQQDKDKKESILKQTSTTIGKGFELDENPPKDKTTNNLPSSVVPSEIVQDKAHEDVYFNPEDEVIVEDCCPKYVYKVMPCCNGDSKSPFWQVWNRHRLLGLK